MRRVPAFAGRSHPVALDGLCQNDGGPFLGLERSLVGGVDLVMIVTTPRDGADLLVVELLHQGREFRIALVPVPPDFAAGQH